LSDSAGCPDAGSISLETLFFPKTASKNLVEVDGAWMLRP
jgi:hypothetical protein